MARQRSDLDNLRAGAFLLVSLVAAMAIVLILAGVADKLKARSPYTVFFPLGSEPYGLEVDSAVLVNGRPVGVVNGIRLELDPTNEEPDGTYFRIFVDRKIRFYGEPTAFLNRPLLGAGATLNFPTIGDVGAAPQAQPGAIFKGAIAPPSFLAQAGYGPEQQAQVQDILSRGSAFATELESMVKDFRETTYPKLTELVAEVESRFGGWLDSGDRVVANVETATDRFPAISESIEARVTEARAVIATTQEILDENRPTVKATIENAEQATERFNALVESLRTDTKPTIDAMLVDARSAMESTRKAVERADSLLAESSPSLRRTVANARLASDQLKFTLEEVRRSPWRLLYRPDTRELEFELLYDSARIYAAAVSDLRDASAALEEASASANATGSTLSGRRAEDLNAELTRAFESYRAAERAFLDLIIERGAPGGTSGGAGGAGGDGGAGGAGGERE
jgi:ABC-type transporter Mla subunit MlaD